MAWTGYPTWAIGQVSTASDWNTYVNANINFLAAPAFAYVYRANAITVTSQNPAAYDTVRTDSVGGFNVSTHLYTVAVAGTYVVDVAWSASGVSDFSWLNLFVRYNGAVWSTYDGCPTGAAGGDIGYQYSDMVGPCIVGDTLSGSTNASGSFAAVDLAGFACFMAILKVSN